MTDDLPVGDGGDAEIAVVGVGNEIRGDDGVGPKVIQRLERSNLESAEGVRLVDAGTTGFFALEAMSGADRAVVVDAIGTGAEPGTVHEYRCVEGSFETDVPDMTMHDVSFTEAMTVGRDVYDLPNEIRILGVEPETVAVGTELSEPVDRAAGELIDVLTEAMIDRKENGHSSNANNAKSMKATWYCNDCETRIDKEEIADHEEDGHEVEGVMRPDRLIGNDPWNMDVQYDDDRTEESEEVTD